MADARQTNNHDDTGLRWEMLAEIYAKEAMEWIKICPDVERCPAYKIFKFLIVQQMKIERLESEIKRIENWPNEV